MIKLGKIHNDNEIEVFEGSDNVWARSNGYVEIDVIMCNDNIWRLVSEVESEEFKAKELEEAKVLKHAENIQKRDERLRAGVEFKGVMFDSDTDSKVNIMGAVSTLPDDAVVGWNSMDNQTVILTKAELNELGGLLVTLTSLIWGENGLNVQFINAINAAQSLEEVAAIEIDYSVGVE